MVPKKSFQCAAPTCRAATDPNSLSVRLSHLIFRLTKCSGRLLEKAQARTSWAGKIRLLHKSERTATAEVRQCFIWRSVWGDVPTPETSVCCLIHTMSSLFYRSLFCATLRPPPRICSFPESPERTGQSCLCHYNIAWLQATAISLLSTWQHTQPFLITNLLQRLERKDKVVKHIADTTTLADSQAHWQEQGKDTLQVISAPAALYDTSLCH